LPGDGSVSSSGNLQETAHDLQTQNERLKSKKMETTGTKKQSVAAEEPVKQALRHEPSEEEIRNRAYEIYMARGGAPGDELEDWLQAERELRLG
jgi:hypothetical protein